MKSTIKQEYHVVRAIAFDKTQCAFNLIIQNYKYISTFSYCVHPFISLTALYPHFPMFYGVSAVPTYAVIHMYRIRTRNLHVTNPVS